MGRAANVRAATKSKTDAAKAKKNNRYAKKVVYLRLFGMVFIYQDVVNWTTDQIPNISDVTINILSLASHLLQFFLITLLSRFCLSFA